MSGRLGETGPSAYQRFEATVKSGTPHLPMCEECGSLFFYPRPRCPRCYGDQITFAPATFQWTVRSYTWVTRPQSRAFDARIPILLIAGSAKNVHLIAEGHGWQLRKPPHVGEGVNLTSLNPGEGAVVPVFVPMQENRG